MREVNGIYKINERADRIEALRAGEVESGWEEYVFSKEYGV